MEIKKIKEIADGVYYVLLWCPESHILEKLLDPQMPVVLCWDHQVGNYSWQEFSLPVLDPNDADRVLSRTVKFDFIVPTEKFLKILPGLRPAIKAVQLGKLPPDYLDMSKIQGQPLYDILADCAWHVLLNTPGNDYGQLLSPKREVLELAIELTGFEPPRLHP